MAYVSKELKAKIAAKIKTIIGGKGFRYSLAVHHHSTIVLTIQAGPVDFIAEYNAAKADTVDRYGDTFTPIANNMKINQWDLTGSIFTGDALELADALWKALHTDYFNESDIMTDYHHVSHYVDFQIGRWDKPFTKSDPTSQPKGFDRIKQDHAEYLSKSEPLKA